MASPRSAPVSATRSRSSGGLSATRQDASPSTGADLAVRVTLGRVEGESGPDTGAMADPREDEPRAQAHSSVRAALAVATEWLEDVIATAEGAAVAILEEAEAEARRRLKAAERESRELVASRLALLTEMTDDATERARAASREAEALSRSIESVKTRIEELE